MKRAGDILVKQCHLIINQRNRAVILGVVFAILPITTWLSVAIIALVTLRKGKETGLGILLPLMLAYMLSLVFVMPVHLAILASLLTFIPAFIAAIVLRRTANWSYVFAALMSLAIVFAIIVQLFMPNLLVAFYNKFQLLIAKFSDIPQINELKDFVANKQMYIVAYLLLGIQIVSVAISTLISLVFARFIQSKLFLPGAFKQEILKFRCDKKAVFILLAILIAMYCKIAIAYYCLPLALLYFLMSGINISFIFLAHYKLIGLALFVLSVLINPSVMIVLFILLGILDSFVNFRMFFSVKADKSI